MQALRQVVFHSWAGNRVTSFLDTHSDSLTTRAHPHLRTFEDVVAVLLPHLPGTCHIVSHVRVARGWRASQ